MKLADYNGYTFNVSHKFKGEYLVPIIDNLKVKYLDGYDDYNEVYHCNHLIHVLEADSNVRVDYHVMYKENQCVGLALVSTGKIDAMKYFGQPLFDDDDVIVLNYFHVSSIARGNGSYWLKNIIMPCYSGKDMYVKSSHPKAFSLYQRLGKEIATYQTQSDNGDYTREGKIFKIKVD